jgi:hypothetical protein
MKKKYVAPLLLFIFIIVTAGFINNVFYISKECLGWVLGDWLINYSAGFVRRGLSGELVIFLSDIFHIKMNYVVMWIQIIFYSGFLTMFYLLFFKKKLPVWFVIGLLSPATLLFVVFDQFASGRKEIILFFIFAIYLLVLERKTLSNLSAFCFSILLLLATLFHELVFFYTPYFILAAYISSRLHNTSFNLGGSLFVIAGALIIIIPVYLYGQRIEGGIICNGLKERGLPDSVCLGVLAWPNDYGWKNAIQFARESKYLFVYGSTFLLSLIPFMFFIHSMKQSRVSFRNFFIVFPLLILFSLPMFLVAVDWGRWIHIHLVMLLMTSTLLLKKREDEKEWREQPVEIPQMWPAFSKRLNTLLFSVFIVGYIGLWSMPHFGYSKVFSLTKNFYSIKHIFASIFR